MIQKFDLLGTPKDSNMLPSVVMRKDGSEEKLIVRIVIPYSF